MPPVLADCSTGVLIALAFQLWPPLVVGRSSSLGPLRSGASEFLGSESDPSLILFRGERSYRGRPAGAFGAARGGVAERPDIGCELDDFRLTDLALEARHDR